MSNTHPTAHLDHRNDGDVCIRNTGQHEENELWLEQPGGESELYTALRGEKSPGTVKGALWDTRQWVRIPKGRWHGVMPTKGVGTSIAQHAPSNCEKKRLELLVDLEILGFLLPRGEASEARKIEVACSDAKLLATSWVAEHAAPFGAEELEPREGKLFDDDPLLDP